MSLKNCPSCHQQVSSDAGACPHCGAKLKFFWGTWKSFAMGFASYVVGVILDEMAYRGFISFDERDDVRGCASHPKGRRRMQGRHLGLRSYSLQTGNCLVWFDGCHPKSWLASNSPFGRMSSQGWKHHSQRRRAWSTLVSNERLRVVANYISSMANKKGDSRKESSKTMADCG